MGANSILDPEGSPTYLLIEFGLYGLLVPMSVGAIMVECIRTILQQLPFPLADLVRMDAVFAGQLTKRTLALKGFQSHSKLKIGTESPSLLLHLKTLHVLIKTVGFYTLARGPVIGANYTVFVVSFLPEPIRLGKPCPVSMERYKMLTGKRVKTRAFSA